MPAAHRQPAAPRATRLPGAGHRRRVRDRSEVKGTLPGHPGGPASPAAGPGVAGGSDDGAGDALSVRRAPGSRAGVPGAEVRLRDGDPGDAPLAPPESGDAGLLD